MKSKAQEYTAAAAKVPDFKAPGYHLYVSRTGELMCSSFTTSTSPEIALKLRDWLTDTFDTPVSTDKSNVYHDCEWFNNIKIGFAGRTRGGERMVYAGKHGDLFVWDHPDYAYDINFILLTEMYIDKDHDLDIVGPWEDTK